MRFNWFYPYILLISLQAEEPWGKDADLSYPSSVQEMPCRARNVALSLALIRFHQEVISPADGPRSHYIPSSSQYTYDAISCYGFFKGWILGCDRLMRENDEAWVYRKTLAPDSSPMKWDPVR